MYEGWEADMDQRADDMWEGWQAIQSQLSEDEDYARHMFEVFHGREL